MSDALKEARERVERLPPGYAGFREDLRTILAALEEMGERLKASHPIAGRPDGPEARAVAAEYDAARWKADAASTHIALVAVEAQVARLREALSWVGQVRPSTERRADGYPAVIRMTWREFNAMEDALGLQLQMPANKAARAALFKDYADV